MSNADLAAIARHEAADAMKTAEEMRAIVLSESSEGTQLAAAKVLRDAVRVHRNMAQAAEDFQRMAEAGPGFPGNGS